MSYRKPIRGDLSARVVTKDEIARESLLRTELLELLPPTEQFAHWVREYIDENLSGGLEAAFGGSLEELVSAEGDDEAVHLVAALREELATAGQRLRIDDATCRAEAELARERVLHEWLDLLDLAWRYRSHPVRVVLDADSLLPSVADVHMSSGDTEWATICADSTQELLAAVPLHEKHLAQVRDHMRDALLERSGAVRISSALAVRVRAGQFLLFDPSAKVRSLDQWRKLNRVRDTGRALASQDHRFAADSGEMTASQVVLEHPDVEVSYGELGSVLAIDLRKRKFLGAPPSLATSSMGEIPGAPTDARNRFVIKPLPDGVLADESLEIVLRVSEDSEVRLPLFPDYSSDES